MTGIYRKQVLVLFFLFACLLAINQIIRFIPGINYPSTTIYKIFVAISVAALVAYSFGETRFTYVDCLFILFAVYIVIENLINGNSIVNAVLASSWCIAFVAGNRVSRHGDENSLIGLKTILFVITIVVATYAMYVNYTGNIYARTNIIAVNYIIYFGLPIFLYASINNKRRLETIIMVLWIVLTILSFKRTTLVALATGLVAYIYFKYLKSRKAKDILRFFVIVFLLFAAAIYINNVTDGYIVTRLLIAQETGGNGRTEIWTDVFALIREKSFWGIMFGSGYNAVEAVYGISAHNEILETLFDYGIIGLMFLVAAYFVIIAKAVKAKREGAANAAVYIFTVVVMAIISFFSHIQLYTYVGIPVFFFFGTLYGMKNKRTLS